MGFENRKRQEVQESRCRRNQMSKPYRILLESSCGSKTFSRTLVVLGAEVALSAIFIYDVGEADCHCDTGYCSAETPVVLHPVCLVVGEGHEVHVALLTNQSVCGENGAACSYSNRTPGTAHAVAVLSSVSMRC